MNYDCQSCGACCDPGWLRPNVNINMLVAVGPEDFARSEKVGRLARPCPHSPTGYYMDFHVRDDGTWRCHFLEGEVGESASCTIYDERPDPCRWFSPGWIPCKELREDIGLEIRIEV